MFNHSTDTLTEGTNTDSHNKYEVEEEDGNPKKVRGKKKVKEIEDGNGKTNKKEEEKEKIIRQ